MTLFKDLVYGKRVCIVGPAGYIKDLNHGETIDGYDVIIRLTKMYFIMDDSSEKYLGKKTDVIYTTSYPKEMMMPLFTDNLDRMKRDGVHVKTIHPYRHSLAHEDAFKTWLKRGYDKVLDTSDSSKSFLYLYDGNTPFHLNTGTMSILETLSCYPQELYITGFSYFKDGRDYVNNYSDKLRGDVNNRRLHNSDRDLDITKLAIQSVEKRVNVVMDPVMHKIVYGT